MKTSNVDICRAYGCTDTYLDENVQFEFSWLQDVQAGPETILQNSKNSSENCIENINRGELSADY